MCQGHAPALEEKTGFVGRWMDILKPGYDAIKDNVAQDKMAAALEKEAVKVSLNNLLTFPFVKDAVEQETLSLHGLWTDIGEGSLEFYDAKQQVFTPV